MVKKGSERIEQNSYKQRIIKHSQRENKNLKEEGDKMKESIKIVLSIMVLLGMYLSSMGLATASEISVSIDPATPVVGSSVTFTAEIHGISIYAVYLIVKECTSEFCFPEQNISMGKVDEGRYETGVLLQHENAIYIQYHLSIESDEGWETSEETKVDLLEKPDNGDQTNGEDSENGTPGFEVMPFLISVIIGAILFHRKRLR